MFGVRRETVNMNDSTNETIEHIQRVCQLLDVFRSHLLQRAVVHDRSKLESPEKELFDEVTGALRGLTYGSPEYKEQLVRLKPALDHHYAYNSHHPEHFGYLECNGCFNRYPLNYEARCAVCNNGQFTTRPNVAGMSLLDVVEMFCDWKAATERHADGSMEKSIQINRKRFEMSDQLAEIFENTRRELNW